MFVPYVTELKTANVAMAPAPVMCAMGTGAQTVTTQESAPTVRVSGGAQIAHSPYSVN